MAIISTTNQFIFLHIPKTAGTSVRRVLGKMQSNTPESPEEWHEDLKATKNRMSEEEFSTMFKFTFARNPWDRLYSSYQFICNKKLNSVENIPQEYYKTIGFKKWLLEEEFFVPNNIEPTPEMKPIQTKNLYDWTHDDAGNLLVDFIGKFETLNEDFNKVLEKINFSAVLPVTAQSKRKKDFHTEYDNEMIDYVYKVHAKDIKAFNYEF